MTTTGQLIARARLYANTQENLAMRLGLTKGAVRGWEAGTRQLTVPRLLDVAAALGVPAATLLPEAERKPSVDDAWAHIIAAGHILQQIRRPR
jgi:transcriptional regulator with XRE-family HTH domain